MNVLNHIGPREAEQLVVALDVFVKVLETLTAVLRFIEFEALDHGAHGAVEDGDALLQQGGQGLGPGVDG